jgi:hypothetical protein
MSKLEKSFWAFHYRNPHIYANLVELSRQWRRKRPTSRLGIAALFERLRWDIMVQTDGAEFKLNNGLRAFYARWIMYNNHDLQGLFQINKQREVFSYQPMSIETLMEETETE